MVEERPSKYRRMEKKMKLVTSDNLNPILRAGECSTVEFKTKVGVYNNLPRIISAFANTEGGVIIIGYDERNQSVIGTSDDEFEIVKNDILNNNLEDVCIAYTIQYEEKALIIIQVEKSESIVIAGGGAYIRKGDSSYSVLTSKDVVARIVNSAETSESTESTEVLERLEKKIEQIYDELLRSQKAHEEELNEKKEEHKREIIASKRSNWFFCILSAVIGYVLGKLF